jgi:hypothetical protein
MPFLEKSNEKGPAAYIEMLGRGYGQTNTMSAIRFSGLPKKECLSEALARNDIVTDG